MNESQRYKFSHQPIRVMVSQSLMEDTITYGCKWQECDLIYTSNKTLYLHYVETHLLPQQTMDSLTCSWKNCKYQAANLSSLRSHGLRHIPYRQYACTQCGRTFKWKHDRNKHFTRIHTKHLQQQPSPMMSMYQTLSPYNQVTQNPLTSQLLQNYQSPEFRSTSPSPLMTTYSPNMMSFTAPQLQMFDFMSRDINSSKSPSMLEIIPTEEEETINFTAF